MTWFIAVVLSIASSLSVRIRFLIPFSRSSLAASRRLDTDLEDFFDEHLTDALVVHDLLEKKVVYDSQLIVVLDMCCYDGHAPFYCYFNYTTS